MNLYKRLFVFSFATVFLFTIASTYTEVTASSNDYLSFETITTKQGLSQNYINCIFQDHYGYIWIGTVVGLNKYNGLDFQIYKSDSEAIDSISNSDIQCICESDDGELWIGTENGLNHFNRAKNTFTDYIHSSDDANSISGNSVQALCEDSRGVLWIGTTEGLNSYDEETGIFTAYLSESYPISSDDITSLYEDSNGILWIGTSSGLNNYNPETGVFNTFYHDAISQDSISDNYIITIYEDSNQKIWVGTTNGLNSYDSETGGFITYQNHSDSSASISDNYITAICEDNNGYLWVGTRFGLNKLDIATGIFSTYKVDINNSDSINSNHILSLYKDSEGNLWVGTINGVNALNFRKQVFKYYGGVFYNETVSGISDDGEGNLWLEIRNGVVKFDTETHSVEAVYPDIFQNQYAMNYMYNVFCTGADGSMWIGTENSGLERFDPATGELTIYTNVPGDNTSLPCNNISLLYADSKGIIWIGTNEGLCVYNPATGEFSESHVDDSFSDGIDSVVRVMYEDSEGNLWLGTNTGIYRMDNATGDIVCIMNNAAVVDDTSTTMVLSICEGSNGLFWFGTSFGLYCYSVEQKELVTYGLEDLLPEATNNWILGIVEDDEGDIWIATRQGLGRLSLDDMIYTEYGVDDGLGNDAFCVGSCYKTEDGELFFGCIGGLISFYPDEIQFNTSSLNVVINDFSLTDNEITFNEPVEDIDEISLSYSENSFTIGFVALSFDSTSDIQYAYMLVGFDEGWNFSGARENSTKYTNLNSGEYTFLVMAASSDGIWGEEVTSLKIFIATPFWQQWWFILSMASIAILTVALLMQARTRSLRAHTLLLEAKVEERTHQLAQKSEQLENELDSRVEFIRALIHELKTPLTPILGASEVLASQLEDSRSKGLANNIYVGANRLNQRINELIDLAQGEKNMLKINCKMTDISSLLKEVAGYVLPQITRRKMALVTEIPDHLSPVMIDDERIQQVVINLLDNAIKFSDEGGVITLRAEEKGGEIVVEVKDTGPGIAKSLQERLFQPYHRIESDREHLSGLGLGLSLCRAFVELHGGKIWVSSHKGKGCIFTFTIPLPAGKNEKGVNN
jgi:signal transduction histidine kinase/ligand-binding sensor domain-containing protein